MAAYEASRIDRAHRAALLRGVYLIVNEGARDPVALARDALDAGVRIVQYRAKNGIIPDNLRALRELTQQRTALLIVNDDARAAAAFDCDGVHLGPGDDGFDRSADVRPLLGNRLIGLSCGTIAEAEAANRFGVDYIGVGSVFPTASKADAGDPIGIDGLQRVAGATNLPVAAIGGIDATTIADIARSGVAMAAVISAVANHPHPREAAARLVQLFRNGASPSS